jgi:Mn2+/Fe2+ NRAMP family transporter
MNWMNEDLQKELVWAFGTVVGFIIFLFLGGINEVSEIVISVGAFLLSWSVMSFSLKKYGPNNDSGKELENEMKWFAAILILFLTIMTIIGKTDSELELSYSLYASLVFGYTLIWIIRSSAIKYFN